MAHMITMGRSRDPMWFGMVEENWRGGIRLVCLFFFSLGGLGFFVVDR